MDDVKELYQELILDHSRSPLNFHKLETANRTALGYNPLCGDRISVYLEVDSDKINKVSFDGDGCAICKASASLMTQAVGGKTHKEVLSLFERFHKIITGKKDPDSSTLGKLEAFRGVSEFPLRVKCASLAWHTLKSALENGDSTISTE